MSPTICDTVSRSSVVQGDLKSGGVPSVSSGRTRQDALASLPVLLAVESEQPKKRRAPSPGLCGRISRRTMVAIVMPPLVSRFLLPFILELLVAGLLVFRQDVLETGFELVVLVGQLFQLLLQPFAPGLSLRTVSLFEGSAGGLHAGPKAVAAGLGCRHVALVSLSILLQGLAAQLNGISQDRRCRRSVQGGRTLHVVMMRGTGMVAGGIRATLGLGHSGAETKQQGERDQYSG